MNRRLISLLICLILLIPACFAEGFDELYYVANDGEEMIITEWSDDNEL